MAEKNNKKAQKLKETSAIKADENVFLDVPNQGIAADGDDFDKKYRRAVVEPSFSANRLLSSLSRESKADKYNFLGAFVPAVLIIILALSFVFISRGDIEELFEVKLSGKTILDGSYTQSLNLVYESTLPFSDSIKKAGAILGFCEKPAVQDNTLSETPDDTPNEEPITQPSEAAEPEVTIPAATVTEPPEITTTPAETEEITPATTAETEPEVYDTYIMYASATLNVRFGPSTEDAILGYYNQNDPVEVIEIMEDGWAAVLFDGHKAYAHSNYLSEKKVEVTTRKSSTEATTTQESEITDPPQENVEPEVTFEDEPVNTPEVETETGEIDPNDDVLPNVE